TDGLGPMSIRLASFPVIGSVAVLCADLPESPRDALEDRDGQSWLGHQDLLELPGRKREAGRRGLGGHGRDPRSAVEQRELPEEVAGTELSDRVPIPTDTGTPRRECDT